MTKHTRWRTIRQNPQTQRKAEQIAQELQGTELLNADCKISRLKIIKEINKYVKKEQDIFK